jgi:hypothetical protein
VGDWAHVIVLTAEPAPFVRLVAGLHAPQLAVGSLVASVVLVLVAAAVARRGRTWDLVAGAGPTRSAVVLAGVLVVTFSVLLAGSVVVRAKARDVREDALERADALPGGGTAPALTAASAVVWAVGDAADGHSGARAVGDLIAADNPDRVLYLGDVYGTYGPLMRDAFGPLLSRTWPTPGNHEWPSQAAAYRDFWAAQGHSVSAYYRFRVAGWQILSLNSEIPHTESSPQVRWLRRQVSAPGTCRIAYWHRPRWSAGRHGDQPDVRTLWGTVVGRAALVLGGHDHDMQRMRPVHGTTELVAGAGGHGHYPLHQHDRIVFGDDTHFGALRLRLSPGLARYRFVATDGTVLDRGSVHCATG